MDGRSWKKKNHTRETLLSALVNLLSQYEERGGVKSCLFWKNVSLRGLSQAAQEQGELYVRDREGMFQLYNIYSQHSFDISDIAMHFI